MTQGIHFCVGVRLARAHPQNGTVGGDDDSANFRNPLWVAALVATLGHCDGRFHVRSLCHSSKRLITAPIRRKPAGNRFQRSRWPALPSRPTLLPIFHPCVIQDFCTKNKPAI